MKVRIASTLLLIGVITAALLSEPSGQDTALPEPVCEPVHTIAQNVPSCEPTPYISVAEPTPAELSVSTVQPISVVSEKNTPMDVAFTLTSGIPTSGWDMKPAKKRWNSVPAG